MSKGKKIIEIVVLCLLAFIILYTVFLWKYVLPYAEADGSDKPGSPAGTTGPVMPAEDILPDVDSFGKEASE